MLNPFRRSAPIPVERAEREILPCGSCLQCVRSCPTGALQYRERVWSLDLGLCIYCRECAAICPNALISHRSA